MSITFAENLKRFRVAKGLTQQELAEKIYVTRAAVARWESGSCLPDAVIISRLSKCLETDVNTLISSTLAIDESPNVIMVDDKKIFLTGALTILEEVLPNAIIMGFSRPSEAIEYARTNLITLAFLDIEMGKINGLDLCRMLLKINPYTNVVYLTAHIEIRDYPIRSD